VYTLRVCILAARGDTSDYAKHLAVLDKERPSNYPLWSQAEQVKSSRAEAP
jgi:hypothetical protein